jgi:hypothetical protein
MLNLLIAISYFFIKFHKLFVSSFDIILHIICDPWVSNLFNPNENQYK